MIEIASVSHTFPRHDGKGEPLLVLDDISFSIEEGSFVSFLGPSGCGKTTLLRILDGLITPVAGEVIIDGDVVRRPVADRAMVFQEFNLMPWRTTQKNIEFALEMQGADRATRKRKADETLRLVGLEGFADYYPHELSGGMKQRVGLARALSTTPSYLFMDEPFGALDPQIRELMQIELLKILEGTVSGVPPKGGRKHPEQPLVQINTRNILFICGGAFDGLDKTISHRIGHRAMGFGSANAETILLEGENLLPRVEPEDLIQFGLIPELIGRLPVLSTMHPLSNKALRDILLKPKNALIKQYQKLFEMDGVELRFEEDAIEKVVEMAQVKEMGARGLRAVLETVMFEIMFELPARDDVKECVITRDFIEHKGPPTYIPHRKRA